MEVFACCISAGRPENVQKVRDTFGPVTWIVPPAELVDYANAGAMEVRALGCADNCAVARNGALQAAAEWGVPCLMFDDDPTGKLEHISPQHERTPISFDQTIMELAAARDRYPDARLFAFTHYTNAFFVGARYSTQSTINGGMMLVLPTHLKFDVQLPLNSDVDYGLQHIREYGQAIRINNVFIHMARGNRGDSGVGRYRTTQLRIKTVQRLKQKWPEWVSTRAGSPEHPMVRAPRRHIRHGL